MKSGRFHFGKTNPKNGSVWISCGPNDASGKCRVLICIPYKLGGGFKYFLFSPLFGEDSHFGEHIFQMGGSTITQQRFCSVWLFRTACSQQSRNDKTLRLQPKLLLHPRNEENVLVEEFMGEQ